MDTLGWIQLALYVVALLAITKPLGLHLSKVLDVDGKTFLDPVLKPLEKLTYKLTGVDPHKEQDWKHYTLSMLLFSAVGLLFTYAILRLQAVLPFQNLLNPQNLPAVGEHLSFNTAASFTTNTNWQSYGGESTMSYFSQMVALTFHNWVSAATGIAIAAALVRGIARHTAKTIGNFWTDLTRVSVYLLLPICLFYSIFLVSQGMIQNFKPYTSASLVEPFTAQVPKVDDNGQAVTGADGRTVMITGDNPLTAAAIAKEAGVDDFLAEAKPEDKLALIRKEQEAGHLVAMTGDGTNDAPALAQADVGVAMNTGTQAAKEAGNMVDLDSNPTKLIEVVEIGKQLLITRGALTTFSIANDVAKYFAIIPAMLLGTFPEIAPLNVMRLASPQSAILSAVIFNAIIIILLIPLALKGVKFRPLGAAKILQRNLLIYGLGGIIVPFIGIKLIDLIVAALRLA